MKIYDIMIYLLILNMMLSVLVQVDVFGNSGTMQTYNDTMDWEDYGGNVDISGELSTFDTIYIGVIGLLKAIPMLILAFLQATILLPWFLSTTLNLSFDNPIILMFTGLIWLVYAVGVLQLWMKQSIDTMT
jgi:hypothetical protein